MSEQPRPLSPYLEKEAPDLNDLIYISKIPKIQRIRCRRDYNALITNVVSPGEIWVQIMNNIANDLVIPTSDAPMLEKDLVPDKYIMTPVDEDRLVRGRIIKTESTSDGKNLKVLIRLIDYGIAVWRDANAVFNLPSKLYYFPWQSKPVLLDGIKPKINDVWSTKEAAVLKSILVEFDYVYVKPTLSDYFEPNEDRATMSVSLLGMNGPLEQNTFNDNGVRIAPESSGLDIASLFHICNTSTPDHMEDMNKEEFYQYPEKMDDLFRTTYKSFVIKPNPNNTYVEEKPIGFNDVSKLEQYEKAKTCESLQPRSKFVTLAQENGTGESDA